MITLENVLQLHIFEVLALPEPKISNTRTLLMHASMTLSTTAVVHLRTNSSTLQHGTYKMKWKLKGVYRKLITNTVVFRQYVFFLKTITVCFTHYSTSTVDYRISISSKYPLLSYHSIIFSMSPLLIGICFNWELMRGQERCEPPQS